MGESSGTNDDTPPWASPGFSPEHASAPDGTDHPAPAGPPATDPPPAGYGAGGPSPGTYTFPSLEKQPVEPLAVASLVTSPISPLGLGLGIGALKRLRHNRRRGRGAAVFGIILSALFLAASILVLATFLLDGTFARLTEQPVAGDVDATRTASPINLEVGNCVVTLPVTAQVGEVTLTPCAEEHQLQVVDRIAASTDDYPGEDALFEDAEQRCEATFNDLSPQVESWPTNFRSWFLVPSQDNWSSGERNIICFARSTAGPVALDLLNG